MYCKPVLDFFLGALSPAGFTGWFAQAAATPGVTPYLIKAGPGCGKSTLMRRLAEADAKRPTPRGQHYIERLHCSSDPDSLDGVLLSDVNALFLDATAPHTLDCKYPGAAERIVSLYHALDDDALQAQRSAILALGRRNTALLQQAAAAFALACGLLEQRRVLAASALQTEKLQAFTQRLALRTMPRRRNAARGLQYHRLLSAPTPQGLTIFYETIPTLAHATLYCLQDPYGAAGAAMLEQLAEHAAQNGYDAYLCHCPTDQNRLDHLFVPALGLGFVTANCWHPMRFAHQRNIHLTRLLDADILAKERPTLNYQRRTATALLERAIGYEKKAKAVHDELERCYVAAADFAKIDALRRALETRLFGPAEC